MEMQYQQPTKAIERPALFDFADIHYLLNHDHGLRLTHCRDEMYRGGNGDAVPLSHLAGAKESILFVTLAALLIHDKNLDSIAKYAYLNTLHHILKQYAGEKKSSMHTIPALVLVYAHLLQLFTRDIIIEQSVAERRLPSHEEALLINIYQTSGSALFANLIFDRDSAYYLDLPSLRLHLSSDFNQLLEKRLRLNANLHPAAGPIYYLLLTSSHNKFAFGYHLSKYPLGNTGNVSFQRHDVKSYHKVDKHSPEESIYQVWAWLKQECKAAPPSPQANSPTAYWKKYIEFCEEHQHSLLLAN